MKTPDHGSSSKNVGLGWVLLSSVFLSLGACENETIIEVERPFFDDPPALAGGFLGYDEEVPKLTVCGNCHVGQQSGWKETAHADAWQTLDESGARQSFCEGCHTTSPNGNEADQGGWPATMDTRYYDVQCESCHGPGETHVANPDASKPLARLSVGADLTTGCGECHSGAHQPFIEEWTESPHAHVVEEAAGNPSCEACHRGQATLRAWGENADYVEKFDAEHLPVVCGVCHDPHNATNEHQLRFPVNTVSIEEHLCAQCHNRRTAPSAASSHGLEPHAPEADLLVGDAGWFPPGAAIDQGEIRGTHGSERNEELCATCHLPSFEVRDELTDQFVIRTTGHLFRPIPCVDAQGIPLPFEDECEISTAARDFQACTGGPCHGDEQAAFSALTAAVIRIQDLADELHELLEQVDPNLEAAGGEIDPFNPTFTVAEGAIFNFNLATFGNREFGTNTVVGSSVHNPFLVEALLIASIDAVEEQYGVVAASRRNWKTELREVLAKVGM